MNQGKQNDDPWYQLQTQTNASGAIQGGKVGEK